MAACVAHTTVLHSLWSTGSPSRVKPAAVLPALFGYAVQLKEKELFECVEEAEENDVLMGIEDDD